MRALVHDPAARVGLALAEVAEPEPAADEALVAVGAVSLNAGETRYVAQMRAPGEVPGWDAAGVVVRAAADGSGPPVGARVVTFGWGGAWAERRAVPIAETALVPDGVDLGDAATLPVAGVTALRALRGLGNVLGRRVLVTGASGGVGRFAVQLAAAMGAEVVAAVGAPARGEGLREIGATEIVHGEELEGLTADVAGVVDNVGGPLLARAFARLEPGGVVQAVGSSSEQPLVLDLEAERRRAGGTRLEIMTRGADSAADLTALVGLLAAGRLDPHVGLRRPWTDYEETVDALLGRRVAGKVVLDVTS
ncbi:zinc-binding dehydrogenase [Actinomycetospora termitidis]|uniref:Zinc-binding dehydrogenase n=1 Tax=Actinomycetospora termitidis TaxID=3053470 RepID=A0ABT7MBK7_9PSEU|nr:zinc-binding dehydrogenase [Actinomycetospora sp. Odt1-22]MDL5157841.1 zinc-binding dehydrogenase [Actinomycetospora sp. Odt1-22]